MFVSSHKFLTYGLHNIFKFVASRCKKRLFIPGLDLHKYEFIYKIVSDNLNSYHREKEKRERAKKTAYIAKVNERLGKQIVIR